MPDEGTVLPEHADSQDRSTDEELSGNVLGMLLAGEDTTANTIGWLMWLLHEHPKEWESARAEADAIVGEGS